MNFVGTGVNGKFPSESVTFKKLELLDYYNKTGEYPPRKIGSPISVNLGDNKEVVVKNKKQYMHVEIYKRDEDTHVELKNAKFVLSYEYKDENGNAKRKYVKSAAGRPAEYVNTIDEATQFASGGKAKYLWKEGKYICWEVKNEDEGYQEASLENPLKIATKTITIGEDSDIRFNMTNKRKYINLTGYVWEDIAYQNGKNEETNDLWKDPLDKKDEEKVDTNDKRLQGIQVTLMDLETGSPVLKKNEKGEYIKDSNGNPIKIKTTTNKNGKYQFDKIEIDQLQNYYVEFEYNGMSYESVKSHIKKENGSKAAEGDNREEFNSGYKTIAYQHSIGTANGNNPYGFELTYETKEYESKLLYRADGNKDKYNYGYQGEESKRDPVSGVDSQYTIKANTNYVFGNLAKASVKITKIEKDENGKEVEKEKWIETTPENIRKNGITEINNINLGIKKRVKIDLEVQKDIYSVKVSINGSEHVYRYNDRFKNKDINEIYKVDPKVKFGVEDREGTMSYTRAVYPSDIYYQAGQNDDNKLKVEVIYKIGVRNNIGTNGIVTTVHEFTDYYDKKYYNMKVGKEIDEEKGIIKEESYLSNDLISTDLKKLYGKEERYRKANIQADLEVGNANQDSSIYIQLEVEADKIVDMITNKKESEIAQLKLDNIIEVSSYSTTKENKQTGKKNIYATIDRDSQPGNINIDDITTFEGDTGKAPGLKLVLEEDRKIEGIVFEDKTAQIEVTEEKKIRQGNGKYEEEQEKGISGVKVKLVKTGTEEAVVKYNKIYEKDEEKQSVMAITDSEGRFTLSGFIPDNYQVIYTWGDEIYKVQDYKSTIVNETSHTQKGNTTEDLEWYKNEFKQKYLDIEWNQKTNTEIRVSDALDNYKKRQEIDSQSSNMINVNKQAIEDYKEEGEIITKEGIKETLITKIDSITPTFKVNVEYYKTLDKANDEYLLDDSNEIQFEKNGYVKKKPEYENHLKSIDLGIAKRAKQTLELEKDVKNAKIKLASGPVLIDAEIEIDENGKRDIKATKHATYMQKIETAGKLTNRQIKLEVDSELLQSAQLIISYNFTIKNSSELDYNHEKYYYYGKGHGETENDEVLLKAEQIIDYLDEDITLQTDNTIGSIIPAENYQNKLQDKGLLEKSNEMKDWLKSHQEILVIGNNNNDAYTKKAEYLKPGEKNNNEIQFIGTKLLTNTALDEGIDIENVAEIIQINKTGGATITTMPGNYIPKTEGRLEVDNAEAEAVTIIPPTGSSFEWLAYALIVITSLGIFIIGIVLIKKIVLK